jgi:hypothetical protein
MRRKERAETLRTALFAVEGGLHVVGTGLLNQIVYAGAWPRAQFV